jgi:hypothetical protein
MEVILITLMRRMGLESTAWFRINRLVLLVRFHRVDGAELKRCFRLQSCQNPPPRSTLIPVTAQGIVQQITDHSGFSLSSSCLIADLGPCRGITFRGHDLGSTPKQAKGGLESRSCKPVPRGLS